MQTKKEYQIGRLGTSPAGAAAVTVVAAASSKQASIAVPYSR
jgi:hypothetical protein